MSQRLAEHWCGDCLSLSIIQCGVVYAGEETCAVSFAVLLLFPVRFYFALLQAPPNYGVPDCPLLKSFHGWSEFVCSWFCVLSYELV